MDLRKMTFVGGLSPAELVGGHHVVAPNTSVNREFQIAVARPLAVSLICVDPVADLYWIEVGFPL